MKLQLTKQELKGLKDINKDMKVQELMDDAYEGTISKSKLIQEMFLMGFTVTEIHKKTGIIYAMCYNIITNYITKNGLAGRVEKTERGNNGELKAKVLQMFNEDKKSIADISRETGKAYPQIWKMLKDAGLTGTQKVVGTDVIVVGEQHVQA